MLLISLASLIDIGGQPKVPRRRESHPRLQTTTTERNTVELDLGFTFFVPGKTSRMRFFVVLPKSIPDRQKILGIKYSPKPSKVFHENGNRYAEFVFVEPKKRFKVKIDVKAKLFRYDLSTARKKREKNLSKGRGFKDFLKQEEYIEKDHPKIQQLAESIQGKIETDIVKNIYNFVADNMEYVVPGKKALGAVKALEQKKGDCSEYSDLFVAICRAKDIPARVATGYTMRFDEVSPKHHWVEVYLQKYGWVPFDPSWGDVKNVPFRNRLFGRMNPVYVYLSHIRNDEALHNNHFFTFRYWGDKVKLKDSIEFKQPAEPHRPESMTPQRFN
jgi:transglutaminase-like putative cysteine protease